MLQDFVNTVDLELGEEQLRTPRQLAGWLRAEGLLHGGESLGQADLRRMLALREALRSVLLVHSGEPLDAEAAALVDGEAASAPLRVRLDASGVAGVAPGGEGLGGAIARLLAAAVVASIDGTWSRLKVCRDHDCLAAFYDHSRNGSGAWCTMATCGNRAKARRYRRRAQAAG